MIIKRIIALGIISMFMSGMFVIGITQPVAATYTTHSPIRIDGNNDFTVGNGVTSGSGTEGNPWIIESYSINGTGAGSCIYIGNTTDYFVIRESYLHNASGYGSTQYYENSGVILYNVENGIIEDSIMANNDYGIYIYNSNLNTVENNTAILNVCDGIILLHSSHYNNIISNIADSNYQSGIFISGDGSSSYGCEYNNITENIARDNSCGMYLCLSDNNNISDNDFTLNDEEECVGLVLECSAWNTIIDNNISSNDYGICMGTSSQNNTFANNLIQENMEYGIFIYDGYSYDNNIYHNKFIDNTYQAYDDSENNWDNGYPSGGNYWSDYSGSDTYGGSGQNLSGNDGIGDSTYSDIDGSASSEDEYPHMEADMEQYWYWSKSFGTNLYEQSQVIKQTSDGGFIIGGYTGTSGTNRKAWIVKLYSNRTIEWEKTFSYAAVSHVYDIEQTSDGGYIAALDTNYWSTVRCAWILKLFNNGTIDWQNRYHLYDKGTVIYDIIQTSDGGYAGTGAIFSNPSMKLWVLKINQTGVKTWSKMYGEVSFTMAQEGRSIIQSGGVYYVAGHTSAYGAGIYDVWVLKLNSTGAEIGNKTYGSADYEKASSMIKNSDGDYVITGWTYKSGNYDIFILKISSSLSKVWCYTYGGIGAETPGNIIQTSDGGYAITGSTTSYGNGSADAWMLKLDSDGDIDWQRTYGGTSADYAKFVQETDSGHLIATGYTSSFGVGYTDVWVFQLGPEGGITFDYGSNVVVGISNTTKSTWSLTLNNETVSYATASCTTTATTISPTTTSCTVYTQATYNYGWYKP